MALALLATLGGCDIAGDDPEPAPEEERGGGGRQVEGTFVGRLQGTDALVAVSAPAAQGERRRRNIVVFACGGEVCEWLSGAASGNRFSASSTDDDASATGTLTAKSVSGSIELGGGETIDYKAARATAAAGLYTVRVSDAGRLEGASAGGVGLTGRSTLPDPGRGNVKLADGTRLGFRATRSSGTDALGIKRGEARLIVMPDGRMRGAGSNYYLESR